MKKKLKFFVIILIVIIMALVSIKIYIDKLEIGPEDVYLTMENSTVEYKTTTGAYTWNDKGKHVIADSIQPLQMDFSNIIDVKENDKIYFSGEEWTNIGASLMIAKGRNEVARVTIETNLEEKYFVIPELVAGEYVIQINLESDKGEVWYAAKIRIME